ncbi:hypothetical protein FJNA_07470 [Thermus sp. FJN-A]
MGKRLALFWGGLLLLAACQMAPQAGQDFQAVGVLGGTAAKPTLLGKALDTTSATLTKEGEAFAGNLLPGMVVRVEGKDLGPRVQVQSLEVRVELKGPIAALDPGAGTLQVLGHTVQTDANTRIYEKAGDSYRTLGFSDLAVGDLVEVHGTADGTRVLATYIERYRAATPEVELEGRATLLDTEAKTFLLGGYTVDYAQAQVTGTPKEGAWVEVKGTLSGTTILARKVAFKTPGQSEHGASRRLELEGPLQALDQGAKTFLLLGYTVDYAEATVVGTLTEGAYVEAKGQLDAGDPTLLHAQLVKVKYPRTRPPKAEAEGEITAINVEAQTFALGALGFFADANTLLKRDDPDGPLAFSELKVGDYVEVAYDPGATDAEGRYYAIKVELKER